MTAGILDGRATAAAIKTELKQRVGRLRALGVVPGLATVLVGDDPASQNYVRMKHRDCEQVGIASIRVELPADATAAQLEEAVAALNADPACTGYIVQLPLPGHLDENRALGLIDPDKDADGLHPINLGRLVLNEPAPLPCTPRGIVELVRRHGIEWRGADVCVVGRGITVGRPLGLILTRRSENATVTLCHTGTRNLAGHTRRADIVVAAAGVPGMITADMIRQGAVCIDVGVSRVEDHRGPGPGRVGQGGLGHPESRRGGSHDPRHAAQQCRRPCRGASCKPQRLTGSRRTRGRWRPCLACSQSAC